MVTIFLGLTMGSRYKEGNCSAVVLAKVTWYKLSCTVLVSRALNSKYSLFHILALSLSDTLESIGGLGEIKEGSQGCYLKKWFTQSQTYRPWASTFFTAALFTKSKTATQTVCKTYKTSDNRHELVLPTRLLLRRYFRLQSYTGWEWIRHCPYQFSCFYGGGEGGLK